jgi:serine/threonine protein kinase
VPVLIVDSGPDKGKSLNLASKREIAICGTQEGVALQLSDSLLAPQHFRLVKKGDILTIVDFNNGIPIFINDKIKKSSRLVPGDIIKVGKTYISVEDDEGNTPSQAKTKATPVETDKPASDNAPATSQPPARTKAKAKAKARAHLAIPGYDIESKLGIGGMGVVYKARQVSLDRVVALKILSPGLTKDKEFVGRFLDEARLAGSLTHVNVVQVHDVGDENGNYYICMEYVGGGNLSDILSAQGKLDTKTTIKIIKDIAHGLKFAESKNIVHCDIKPDNIMLNKAGVAKVSDLGIARRTSENQSDQASEVLGSPHFMSPEQAQGKPLDNRSDLYSLGCTMFRMLAGRTIFSGVSAREIMKKQVVEKSPNIQQFAPRINQDLVAVINKLLEKKAEKRFQTAESLIEALEQIDPDEVGAPPSSSGSSGAYRKKNKTSRRSKKSKVRKATSSITAPRSGALSTRVGRQGHHSHTFPFAPLAIVGVILTVLFVIIWVHLAPDPGISVLRKAQGQYDRGDYQGCQNTINNFAIVNAQGKTVDKLKDLQSRALEKIQTSGATQRFTKAWQDYIRLKNSNATRQELLDKLHMLDRQFRHLDFACSQIKNEFPVVKSMPK